MCCMGQIQTRSLATNSNQLFECPTFEETTSFEPRTLSLRAIVLILPKRQATKTN
jgi:hypothetical protein